MSYSKHQAFWDKEYRDPEHLALSDEPAEDLAKFVRWLARSCEKEPQRFVGIERESLILDLGSGNGRNLIYLVKAFGCRGVGYDVSQEAVKIAEKAAEKSLELGSPEALRERVTFIHRSIEGKIDLPDESVDVVLDMMTSHFLEKDAREALLKEVNRVLKPCGWFFFKTFCADDDLHVKRLLRDNPAEEAGSYIHPKIGVSEHVWTEDELTNFFEPNFEIHKVEKSHKHLKHGKPFRRRTMVAYLEKKW